MTVPVTVLGLLPQLDIPGVLSTLIIVVIALVVARLLLNVALKIAIVAAIVVGLLWLFGLLPMIPFL